MNIVQTFKWINVTYSMTRSLTGTIQSLTRSLLYNVILVCDVSYPSKTQHGIRRPDDPNGQQNTPSPNPILGYFLSHAT